MFYIAGSTLLHTFRPIAPVSHFAKLLQILWTFLKEANYKYFFPGLDTPFFLQWPSHIAFWQNFSNQMGFVWTTIAVFAIADKLSICEQSPFVKVGALERWMFQSMWQAHVRFIEVFGSSQFLSFFFTCFIMHYFSASDKSPANMKVLSFTSFMEICCRIACYKKPCCTSYPWH